MFARARAREGNQGNGADPQPLVAPEVLQQANAPGFVDAFAQRFFGVTVTQLSDIGKQVTEFLQQAGKRLEAIETEQRNLRLLTEELLSRQMDKSSDVRPVKP